MLTETATLLFNKTRNTVELIKKNNFRDSVSKFNSPIYFLQTIGFYLEFKARNSELTEIDLQNHLIKYTNRRFYNKALCNIINSAKSKRLKYVFYHHHFINLLCNLKLCYHPYDHYGFPFPSGPSAFIFSSIFDVVELMESEINLGELENTFKLYHNPEYRCPSVNMEIIRCNNMLQYSKIFDDKTYFEYAREVFNRNIRDRLLDDGGINDSFTRENLVSNAYTVLSYYYLIKINKLLHDKELNNFLVKGKKFIISLISPEGGSFFIGRSSGYIWPFSYLLNILFYYDEVKLIGNVLTHLENNFIESDYIKRNPSKVTLNYKYGPFSTYVMLFAAKYAEFYKSYMNKYSAEPTNKSSVTEYTSYEKEIFTYPVSSIISASFKKYHIQISGLCEPYFFFINSGIIAYLESEKVPVVINSGRGKHYSFPVMSTRDKANKIYEFRNANTREINKNSIMARYEAGNLILEKRISVEREQVIKLFNLMQVNNKDDEYCSKYYLVLTKGFYNNYIKEKRHVCLITVDGVNLSDVHFNNIYYDHDHFCEIIYFEYETCKKNISIIYSFR